MDDLISRAYLLGVFKNFPATNGAIPKKAVEALIEDAPVADNVVHGEWVKTRLAGEYQCSNCHSVEYEYLTKSGFKLHSFCPNCGAKMDLKQALAEMEE